MDIEKNVIALRIRYSGKVSYLTIQKPIILIGSLATTAIAVLKGGGAHMAAASIPREYFQS